MSSPNQSTGSAAGASAEQRRKDVRRILSRLGTLRTRIRAIFATIGISRWVVYAIGCLALFFLADRFLDLPLGVRQFVRLGLLQPPPGMHGLVLVPLFAISAFLAIALTRRRHSAAPFFAFVVAGLAGVFVYLAVRVFMPLRARLPDADLALSVEARFGDLNDRLAAALDFQKELSAPSRGESTAMMEHVVHEAAEAARGLRFSQAVTGRRALRWSGAALLVVLLAAGATAALKDDVSLWARRSLLLEDVAWPRDTHMVAVALQADGTFLPHDPATPYEVPIGRSLTIYAQAIGTVPDDPQVLDLVTGEDALARRMFGVPGKAGIFAYEFLDVRRPFSFVVRGGDDDDDIPRYGVEITIPPRVLSITSTITFPAYLKREPEVVQDGSITVPEGSKVAVRFTTDLEIALAQAALGDEILPAQAVTGSNGRAFTFAYEAKQSRSGRLVLKTPSGKSNDASADSFDVRVRADAAPRVDWIWPRTSLEITPGGRLPLLARAGDDHGVVSLALDLRVNADEPRRFELTRFVGSSPDGDDAPTGMRSEIPTAVNNVAFGGPAVFSYVPVEIAALRRADGKPLEASDVIGFRLTATDSRGQTRESEWVRADIGPPGALERSLATQRANVRTALEAVQREQAARLADIKTLESAAIGRPELDLLKTVRFAQSKIAQDADRAVQELITVFNGFVYDRLGAQNPNAKILGFLDRHHRTGYGVAKKADAPSGRQPGGGSDGLGDAWLGDPVFPYALYDDIVAAWRSKVIYDKGLLDKMCSVLADGTDVGSRLAPAAHRDAAAAVTGEATAIATLIRAQTANLKALDRLLTAMKGWQNLSDVTIWLRGVIEEQKSLYKEMESGGADSEKRDTK